MKKAIQISALLFLLAACSGSVDMSKLKKGMSGKDVVAAVGEPKEKKEMFMGISWWMYGSNQCVVMANDSVTEVVADMKAALDSSKKEMDKASEEMKKLGQ